MCERIILLSRILFETVHKTELADESYNAVKFKKKKKKNQLLLEICERIVLFQSDLLNRF